MIRNFLILLCCAACSCFAQKDSALANIQEMRNELDQYLQKTVPPPAVAEKPDVVFLKKSVYDSLIDLVQKQQLLLTTYQQSTGKMLAQVKTIKTEGISVSKQAVDSVFFETNSSDLSATAKQKIDEYVKLFGTNKYFNVEGFADKIGDKDINFSLSKSRAFAVKQYIAKKYKINSDKITASYYGNDLLACPFADSEICNKLNRRVEIRAR